MAHHPFVTQSGGFEIKLRVCLLGSGSGGNTAYIGHPSDGKREGQGVLIDAGLSATQIVSRLRAIQVDIREIKGVLITHEHQDHVNGADQLALHYQIPIYANEGTCLAAKNLRKLPVSVRFFETGVPFWVDPFFIHPFSVSHDAADPVGYTVRTDWHQVGMVTDLGCLTPSLDALRGCDLLILESNYDPHLLQHGPYPDHLKKRVLGNRGHLSNEDSCRLLRTLLHPGLKTLFLAHLSQKNNLPHLASQAAEAALEKAESDVRLYLGWQDFVSPIAMLG